MADAPVILFVDDEKRLWEPYRQYFQSRGYVARFAEDGYAGVAAVREGGVQLVVMDLNMPHVDGQLSIEVLEQIAPGTPVIIVSGYVTPEQTEEGMPGAFRAFLKPVDLPKLEAAVKEALAR
jgi:DNA-binding NtrC family response regulator